jgi:hypothetical protein
MLSIKLDVQHLHVVSLMELSFIMLVVDFYGIPIVQVILKSHN